MKAVCSLTKENKQTIISLLKKGEKGTNLALFFNRQAADLRLYTKPKRIS